MQDEKPKSKRVKDQPVDYDELKQKRTINLTDTAWQILGSLAKKDGISKSEKLERMIREKGQP